MFGAGLRVNMVSAMMRYLIEKYFTLKTLRSICGVALLFLLTGCVDGDDISSGNNKNFEAQGSCWQAKIISLLLSQVDRLFSAASDKVTSGGGAGVILLAFSIWMAFRLLKILPSFKEENIGEVWTEIGQRLFLCSFCAWAVSSDTMIKEVINLFVVPIYNTLLELGADVLGQEQVSSIDLGRIFGEVTFSANYNRCEAGTLDPSNIRGGIEPMATCLTCSISDKLNTGIKISLGTMATGNLGGILVGLMTMLIFIAAKFCFIFCIIDALFRINFAVFLFPVLIMGVPFPNTRKWSKQGFLMFLNSAGILLFLAILIGAAINAIVFIFGDYSRGESLTKENVEGMGPVLLSMFMLSLLFVNLPNMAVSLANKFIGGGGTDAFQKKVSQFIIRTVKKTASAVLSTVTQGATDNITKTLEKYEVTREAIDTIKHKKQAIKNSLNSLAGYNDDD